MKREIKVFLRQSFTESDEQQQILIQKIIDKVVGYKSEYSEVSIVNGNKAHNKDTFKQSAIGFIVQIRPFYYRKNFHEWKFCLWSGL